MNNATTQPGTATMVRFLARTCEELLNRYNETPDKANYGRLMAARRELAEVRQGR